MQVMVVVVMIVVVVLILAVVVTVKVVVVIVVYVMVVLVVMMVVCGGSDGDGVRGARNVLVIVDDVLFGLRTLLRLNHLRGGEVDWHPPYNLHPL